MMKQILIMSLSVLISSAGYAQQNWCGLDSRLDKLITNDPSLLNVIKDQQALAHELQQERSAENGQRGGGPRIIPVVFHVVHQGGNENISYAQIQDQIRIMNEDYSRSNADTTNTREIFQPVAANSNVEFRLAKLDPQGNCTDGIDRVWSGLTYNATDAVKAVSYWNSSRYFNVWTVASIDNDGSAGTVLGYAQLPGLGSAQTDGVVIRADYVGSIGTAQSNNNAGRVLTHESGHWLGLLHTFQGGCSGGFFAETVDDTPPVAEANFGCPIGVNSCTNDSPDLPDQIENYMDYSNGTCQNMFTLGQKDIFDAVLSSTRSQIHSASNLDQTGVSNLNETPCQPYADFFADSRLVCAGNDITFTDNSYNGEVTSYSWQLTGATPSSSTDQNPTVSYADPGVYSVTMTVQNALGSDTQTKTDYVTVLPATAEITSYFSFEGFENAQPNYLVIEDELGSTWAETNTPFSGSRGIYLNNFSGNPLDSKDELLLPSVNLTLMTTPKLYFRLAYKQQTGQSDNLRVYVSRNCGENWSMRYNKSGASLSTVNGTTGSSFTPGSAADWEQVEVNLSSFADDPHVMVKFRGTSGEGNNIYIDDIQISGPLGIIDLNDGPDMMLIPNPTQDHQAQVVLQVLESGTYRVSVSDITGRQTAVLFDGRLNAGEQRFTLDRKVLHASGIYLVAVQNDLGRTVQKLVVE